MLTVIYTYVSVCTTLSQRKSIFRDLCNMKCSKENVILQGIFHVVPRFPLHFMLYRGNLDYFSDSVVYNFTVSKFFFQNTFAYAQKLGFKKIQQGSTVKLSCLEQCWKGDSLQCCEIPEGSETKNGIINILLFAIAGHALFWETFLCFRCQTLKIISSSTK